LSIQLFSQEANDSFKKYNLGSRIQFNQVHIILGFKINNNVEILTQAGYQFRYIESYERISRIRLGVLPMLASSGFMYEFGLLSTQKKINFYYGCQFKHTKILEGRDTYLDWRDLSTINDNYSRQDLSINLKSQVSVRVNKLMEPYLGIGIRGTRTFYDFSGTFSDEFKYHVTPSLHMGIRFIFLEFNVQ